MCACTYTHTPSAFLLSLPPSSTPPSSWGRGSPAFSRSHHLPSPRLCLLSHPSSPHPSAVPWGFPLFFPPRLISWWHYQERQLQIRFPRLPVGTWGRSSLEKEGVTISRQVPYSSEHLQLSPEAAPGQAGRAAGGVGPQWGKAYPSGGAAPPEHQLLCLQQGEKQRDTEREVKSGPSMLAGRDGGKSPSACRALPVSACASLASVYLSIEWERWPCQLCRAI